MAIFPKFFEAFMTYIIRLNRDKEIKLFPELSINKIFGDSFVRFISDRSLCLKYMKIAFRVLHGNFRPIYLLQVNENDNEEHGFIVSCC